MSSAGSFVAGTIEDILVALAQGLRDAQDRLNQLDPFDEYGRPRPQYYLPQLDFSLKIDAVETRKEDSAPAPQESLGAPLDTRRGRLAYSAVRAPAINFALASPARSSSTSSTSEVHSTISGRFVAVPPNEGMPQVALTIAATTHPQGGRTRRIAVTSAHAAGDPIAGATVEFNVDAAATAALNNLSAPVVVDHLRFFESGAVATDSGGVAATSIDFAAAPAGISKVLVVANLGPVHASLLVAEAP